MVVTGIMTITVDGIVVEDITAGDTAAGIAVEAITAGGMAAEVMMVAIVAVTMAAIAKFNASYFINKFNLSTRPAIIVRVAC